MIPCAIRLEDYIYQNTPIEYSFNSELDLVSKEDPRITNNVTSLRSNDKIICESMPNGEFKIIMSDNTKYFSDICSTQVQLVTLQRGSEGHSVILILNHGEQKSFSVIDPNGGGTKVGPDLDDILFSKMLGKIMTDYKNEEVVFPPCQRMSVFIANSCHIWSLLFTELIVRFSLIEAKTFFESKSPVDMNNLIAKYATYIMKVLESRQGINDFIYSDYYVKAEEIRNKISEVNIKSTSSKRDGNQDQIMIETFMYRNLSRDEVLVLQRDNILVILLGYTGWIIQIKNPENKQTYYLKSIHSEKETKTIDLQELSTLIKAYPGNFKKLEEEILNPIIKFGFDTINTLGTKMYKTNPLVTLHFPAKGYIRRN